MASKEEPSQPLNYKTCVLKVSIHCEGCKKKVKKILKNINGVHSVDIDALQNKVTVAGDVDAETLIRRLAKSGKNADMWPEKKPANPNPNPNPNPSTKPKEKNKEKESEPAAKEVVASAADKTPAATSSEPAAKPAETATKPVETATKPSETAAKPAGTAAKPAETTAEPAKKEAAESSSSKEEAAKPDKKPEKEPADTKSDTDTKPAETSAKPGGSGKKKGKKQEELPAAWEGHSGNSPHNRALPVYQVPVYAVSHNTAAPMASHSYYYAPTPAMPQSYAAHSAYNYSQPQPPPQQPEYYPSGNYSYNGPDNYYGPSQQHSYSYYGSSSTELRASPSRSYPSQGQGQGGLDMFNDENANSCSVM
ncbi:heavy metal-associated isoprenylated plant protein 35-like [Iris pallida]|uniref:Heavy metal-associated isoprenylated plant protein 35-like n=1 Tax=Iris pallida TaxID=29817 RepID=A0AAX6FLQ5_IRIPA|nr:heavy metal-associated isoprenylated plant protein 35-like [Iris pallida]